MPYEHLRLEKEAPLADRHPRTGRGTAAPTDPKGHGDALARSFRAVRDLTVDERDVGGFDDRRLLKIRLREGVGMLPAFEVIPGIEVVSQEARAVVLAFATDAGLDEVERRLTALARDGAVTRAELLYAIDGFDQWTPEDRMGAALRQQGFRDAPVQVLDVELWPQEQPLRRQAALGSFREFAVGLDVELLDQVVSPSLLMVRVRCTSEAAHLLLRNRDVRTIDLPPLHGLSVGVVLADVNRFPTVGPPPDDAPMIGVLDSGLVTGHPLLATAVGDAQGFVLPNRSPDDSAPAWHGSFVAGLALYGDVSARIGEGAFTPSLRILSGRVFNHDGDDQTEFVENAVERAVRELSGQYGCRVFNLSYGDLNKVYDGRHVRGLAYTLDRLTRELGVLFVVPTGNLTELGLPDDPVAAFPQYLLDDSSRLLDPATAINAITVGGLSRHEATREAQRHPDHIESRPISRRDCPFPLTRCGPSIGGAIKPDLVEHAGNIAVTRQPGRTDHRGLGVVSTNGGFAGGHAFKEDIGTSFAAPAVAHRASLLLRELPRASNHLLRALLGAHARWPEASASLLNPDDDPAGRDRAARLLGYGFVQDGALLQSLDNAVSLVAEERIANDQCQFFAVPIPDELWQGGRRTREVSVALAYSPAVRTTRLAYRMTRLKYSLVASDNLDSVIRAFQRNRDQGMGERATARWISGDARNCGTLQVSRWSFRQRLQGSLYVVVTRQDAPWSTVANEPEPYGLCVAITDLQNAESRLYAQIQAILRARVEQRARVRAGA